MMSLHERQKAWGLPPSLQPRFLDDARHDPTLAAAERPRGHECDRVARLRALLVMRHEARREPLLFAVQAVAHLALDGDHHALGHLVADDGAVNLSFRHRSPLRTL